MKLPRVKCIFVATLLLTIAAAPDCAGGEKIATYVNGKRVDFASLGRSGPLPTLLIQGHTMLPARFFDEVLHQDFDLHLLHWGILRISWFSLKLGEKEACYPVPKVGGSARAQVALPLAPTEIDGRVYVPARAILNALGYAVRWDGQGRAVYITKDGAPQKKRP